MKVIAFNGSPNKEGNTFLLIKHTLDVLEKAGIETEIIQIGGKNIHSCTACHKCHENQDKRCVLTTDIVNECIEKMIEADAIIIGSPTWFSSVTPEIKAFLDRAFVVGNSNGHVFRRKLGAAIAAEYRAGSIFVLDTINHYFGISGMYTAGSMYWNLGKGMNPGDVENDTMGIETMKQLGENILWFVKNKPADAK
jgi:multimeric flavodoxin WrbA